MSKACSRVGGLSGGASRAAKRLLRTTSGCPTARDCACCLTAALPQMALQPLPQITTQGMSCKALRRARSREASPRGAGSDLPVECRGGSVGEGGSS